MIKEYRYGHVGKNSWRENGELEARVDTDSHKMILGREAKEYLDSIEECQELVSIIMSKLDEYEVDSMDIYADEESGGLVINILLFDDEGRQVQEPFSACLYASLDALEFTLFTIEHFFDTINYFYVKSYQRCDSIDYLNEHYEIGSKPIEKGRYYR